MRPTLLPFFTLLGVLTGCGDMGLAAVPEMTVSADSVPAVDDETVASYSAETALDIEGALYAVAPEDIRVVEPEGLDAMVEQFLDRDLLVYVADEGEDEISLDVALADTNGQQNPCERVLALPAGDWADPSFDVGPGELTTTFGGGNPATFQSLRMQGTFEDEGDAWGGRLSAVLDARELAPALPEIDDICDLVDALGGSCGACDDGSMSCFSLQFEDLHGELVDRAFDRTPTCD